MSAGLNQSSQPARRRAGAGAALAAVLALSLLIAAAAQSGSRDLDPKLGEAGKVVTRFGHSRAAEASALSVALQPDRKIVAVGRASVRAGDEWALARYRPSGRLDRTFSGNGKVRTDFGHRAFDVALQRDRRILVVGQGDPTPNGTLNDDSFALARYRPDGSLHQTFGDDGEVMTTVGSHESAATTVGLERDGEIVAAGWGIASGFDFALARYNPDGSLDPSFGASGVALTDFGYPFGERASDLALQPDGRIVVVGTGITDSREQTGDVIAARYMPDGSLDPSFSDDGKLTLPDGAGYGVALQGDGKVLIAADTGPLTVIRLLNDGNLDPGFAEGGVGRYPGTDAADVAELSDGRIVVAGGDLEFALVVLRSDGTLDTSYSEDGATSVDFFGEDNEVGRLAVQPNGKVVVAGRVTKRSDNRFALARFRAP